MPRYIPSRGLPCRTFRFVGCSNTADGLFQQSFAGYRSWWFSVIRLNFGDTARRTLKFGITETRMAMICRPWITLRNGKRLYASACGKRAFCFFVENIREKKEPAVEPADSAK